ncbi:DUF2513 domain-containing protein [Bifidobacterium vansinderenii]|uniref:DUF2513 domain-containing protein n=1 Tax=Bifidobacterium vansinderenii TaxID=1984871 RepID=A0A229W055_9BIFI|nr:DUF2513 domain-containing protein [Bifidobacterium vansinderenii]OXN01222.1 hypothetical protein Tam10B_0222 [Bifidobacterium vansinderenii]
MRRDLDLVRTILKTCADSPEPVGARVFVDDTHSFDLVAYHVQIMQSAGLIEANIIRTFDGGIVRADILSLTWEGNDFLDAVRSDTIWSKTKQKIATTVGSVAFELVKTVATRFASQALGL